MLNPCLQSDFFQMNAQVLSMAMKYERINVTRAHASEMKIIGLFRYTFQLLWKSIYGMAINLLNYQLSEFLLRSVL